MTRSSFAARLKRYQQRRNQQQRQDGQKDQKRQRPAPTGQPQQWQPEQPKSVPLLLLLIKVALFLAAAVLMALSIAPYIFLVRQFSQTLQGDVICSQLGLTPFIGPALQTGCGTVGTIFYVGGGFLVWWIFQSLELVPIASKFNVPAMRGMLRRMQDAPQVPESEGDRPAVAKLKREINSVSERSFNQLLRWSFLVYAIDLVLMCWLYPPLSPTGEFNFVAFALVILGVFGVELILGLLTIINNVIDPSAIAHPTARGREVKNYT